MTITNPQFSGHIASTVTESTPWWPATDVDSRPNVLIILLDDVGFGQLGCYGSRIRTPHIDALAGRGLRYTNFHATPMCSPTRACLLTGRNHHSVGVGYLADFDTGFPGYRGMVNPQAATLAEILSDAGYGTYAAGKWHLTPPSDLTAAGPFKHWPTHRGFDRWFGFLWGEDDQWHPELWEDQHRVQEEPLAGRHLTQDLVNRSCQYLSDHLSGTPDRPFFLYLALGACHAPHQAPAEYIDAYRGWFDDGWDVARAEQLERQKEVGVIPFGTKLSPRNPDVPAWQALLPEERLQCARLQEAFAGFMTHTDDQIGRLLGYLQACGVADNTLTIVMSDNGASGEGGRTGSTNEYRYFLGLPEPVRIDAEDLSAVGSEWTHNHYPSGWAQAGNTPLKYYKKHTYGGGIRVPFILRAPDCSSRHTSYADVAGVGIRRQFHHAIDVMPTVLDIIGVKPPDQRHGVNQLPVHGTSMRYSIDDADAATTRTSQYFEMGGQRGIYRDGWKAVTMHAVGTAYSSDRWELYRIDDDFSEVNDLAAECPDLVADLEREWWSAAAEYGVLPLDDRAQARVFSGQPSAHHAQQRRMFAGSRVMSTAIVDFASRPFRITARTADVDASTEGVILAHGRRAAGFSLYLKNSRLCFHYNLAGDHHLIVTAKHPLCNVDRFAVEVEQGAATVRATLLINDDVCARGHLPGLFPAGFGTFSTQCGHNSPSSVSSDYKPPFTFTATLCDVDIILGERDSAAVDAVTQALRQQ